MFEMVRGGAFEASVNVICQSAEAFGKQKFQRDSLALQEPVGLRASIARIDPSEDIFCNFCAP